MNHPIRVGIGGWSFEPWDETFYPPGLPKSRQLEYSSRKMTAVEVNATYYSSFKPDTFAKWRDASPDGFVFSLKAHRFAVTRKTKDDMKKAVDWFIASGVATLDEKLGPINWQFQNKAFDPEYFDSFLSVLPRKIGKLDGRHALEVRHRSYDDPRFFDLLSKHGVTVVYAEDDEYPKLRHEGAGFAVARLMQTKSSEPTGYAKPDIDRLAKLFTDWSKSQDVFAFFISGAKERNPAAAMALLDRLGLAPATAKQADELVSGKGKVAAAKTAVGKPAKKAPAGKPAAAKADPPKRTPPKKKK